jgi:hypothetical protein
MRVGSLQESVTVRVMILCGLALVIFGIFVSQRVSALATEITLQQQENEWALNEFGTTRVEQLQP